MIYLAFGLFLRSLRSGDTNLKESPFSVSQSSVCLRHKPCKMMCLRPRPLVTVKSSESARSIEIRF